MANKFKFAVYHGMGLIIETKDNFRVVLEPARKFVPELLELGSGGRFRIGSVPNDLSRGLRTSRLRRLRTAKLTLPEKGWLDGSLK